MHCKGNLKEYEVVGTKMSSFEENKESDQAGSNLPLYRLRVFASDEVKAISLFSKSARLVLKLKRSNLKVVSVNIIPESNVERKVRNYGIFAVVRQLKSGRVHKICKEVRALYKKDAVRKFIDSTCGQYSIDANQVNICKIEEVTDPSKLKNLNIINLSKSTVAFPKASKTKTIADRKFKGFMPFKPSTRR
ncbi:MAG: 60S ribosomal protein L18A [Paramarteilia canceri]